MLRYFCVRLTEVEAVDVRMSSHCKVSYRILLVACHVIKDKDGIRKHWWNDVAIIEEYKIAEFLDRC